MKVLQINATYGAGSTGTIVRDIHNLCINNNIDSYVAYSTSPILPGNIKNGYKIGGVFGKKLHALLCRINGMQGYFSRFSTMKLLTHISKIRPDVIHLHNLHSNYIHLNMLLKYLAKTNIKTVLSLHDCWFFTGGCFHYTATGCNRWQKTCGNCPKKTKDTPAFLLDRSQKILNDRAKYLGKIKNLTVVGVSKWISDETKKSILKDKSITYIHNGIDLNIFKPTPSDLRNIYNIGEDKFVVLGPASKFLADINKSIFKELVSRMDDNTVLALFGCNDEQLNALPENVVGIPFIKDRYELAKVYSMADLFVNISREDTLATVNIESQACGTPVIAFNNTGMPETVDGCCSFIMENGNIDTVYKNIEIIKKNKDVIPRQCIEWVENNFEINLNYNKYLELYTGMKSR